MSFKRILGLVVLIAGVAMLLFSNYILNQVAQGKEKISSAETQVERGNSLFSMNPVAKEVGKGLTNSAQKKIRSGKEEVSKYEELAKTLKIAGIAASALGVLLILLGGKRKPARR